MLGQVGDVIASLTEPSSWLEVGDTVADVLEEAWDILESYYSDMLIGAVQSFIVDPPLGWLPLDGSTYSGVDYPELFAKLPASLKSGSDFTLPDVDGAFCQGVGSYVDAGQVVGSNSLTLSVAQMPVHDHVYTPPALTVEVETPVVPIPGATVGAPTTTSTAGSGDPIDIRPLRFGVVWAVYSGRAV
jgi:microcystin-dependent protein